MPLAAPVLEGQLDDERSQPWAGLDPPLPSSNSATNTQNKAAGHSSKGARDKSEALFRLLAMSSARWQWRVKTRPTALPGMACRFLA
jgi:hypothetical protein